MLTEVFITPFGFHIVKLEEKPPAQYKEMKGKTRVTKVVMPGKLMF